MKLTSGSCSPLLELLDFSFVRLSFSFCLSATFLFSEVEIDPFKEDLVWGPGRRFPPFLLVDLIALPGMVNPFSSQIVTKRIFSETEYQILDRSD